MADIEAPQVTIGTLSEAMAWGDSWREAYCTLLREHRLALRELEIQRTFADVFGDAWNRDHYNGVPF